MPDSVPITPWGTMESPWATLFHNLPYKEVLAGGSAGPGKALDVDTDIPTPTGFTKMGSLRVGDMVFDDRGMPTEILGVSRVMYDHECWSLRFDDGSSIVTDAEHEWVTLDYNERASMLRCEHREGKRSGHNDQRSKRRLPSKKTTGEIAKSLKLHGRANHAIMLCGPLQAPEEPLPLDPYTLGVWLGDGTTSAGQITSADEEIIARVVVLTGIRVKHHVDKNAGKASRWAFAGLTKLLRKAGVFGNKHIPMIYQRASEVQRMALLRGLIDTDGHIDRDGRVELTLCRQVLAVDALQLVEGLGFKATFRESAAMLHGKEVGRRWRLSFSPMGRQVASLARKVERIGTGTRTQRWRYVEDAFPVESVPVRCIYVAAASHQYLAGRNFIPTHNTTCLLEDPLPQIYMEHERCSNKDHPYPLRWGESSGWALHLRRTLKMLRQSMVRTQRMFPLIDPGAKWQESEATWIFSSGYRFQFGHCQHAGSWADFMGLELCVAEGTRIVMADDELKPIENVQVGDLVMTLEGPKRVTAKSAAGRKPCVEVTVQGPYGFVGTQKHPTTHPVLLGSIDRYGVSPSPYSRRSVLRSSPHGYVWQDYESLLCGRPESPVRRASLIDEETDSAGSRGSPPATSRLRALSVPVVLLERRVLRAAGKKRSPTESRGPGTSASPSVYQYRVSLQPRRGSIDYLARGFEVSLSGPGSTSEMTSCGSACGASHRQTLADLTGHCWSYTHLRGERSLLFGETGQGNVQPQGDAAGHDPTSTLPGDRADTRTGTRNEERFYPHFYTGQARVRSEGLLTGEAQMAFCGFENTWDLTVEDANHYISSTGLVNANTHLGFDELVQFDEEQYMQIDTRVRSSDPVLSKMLRTRSCTNPSMVMEAEDTFAVKDPYWVRRYFVDEAPQGKVVLYREVEHDDGTKEVFDRMYLPATIDDNPDKAFVKQYKGRLLSRPRHIREALLYGNWYFTPGSYYGEEWNERLHTCQPFRIPNDWPVFRSMDWGYKHHGCIHWWALDDDDNLYCIRELFFIGKRDEEVAQMVKEVETGMGLWRNGKSAITGPADTQLWEQRGATSRSMAAAFERKGVHWVKCDKGKTVQRSAEMLLGRLKDHKDGTTTPGIVFFRTCPQVIRAIPMIQADPNNTSVPKDVGDNSHPHDSVRYACQYAARGRKGIAKVRRQKDRWEDEEKAAPKRRTGNYGSTA